LLAIRDSKSPRPLRRRMTSPPWSRAAGRPDLAGDALGRVRAPVLLIVGGADAAVLDLNRSALARLTAIKKLEIVPGATHLFEEPGALEAVVVLAANWFEAHCRRGAS
jgi:putative phosphoribosyl transferase